MNTWVHRIALLATLTFATGLAGCALSDDVEEEEEEALDETSEDALSGAGIVPQVSIRGIKLGMTERQVRAIRGKPDAVVHWGTGDAGHFDYGLTRVQFGADGRVVVVRTWSQGVRTKEGVGVRSLVLNVRSLPNMRCSTRRELVDLEPVYRHQCAISSAASLTIFDFPPTDDPEFGANAKVSMVTLWKR